MKLVPVVHPNLGALALIVNDRGRVAIDAFI